MRMHLRLLAAALAAVLVLTVASPAHAGTFTNNYSGKDSAKTTTLNYSASHKSFYLYVWVSGAPVNGNAFFTIKMYDKSSTLVWSARDQAGRTYFIGSNVTKIVVSRYDTHANVFNRWVRR